MNNETKKAYLELELSELWPELSRHIRKARQPHVCTWCMEIIKKGAFYRIDKGKVPEYDGIYTHKYCEACLSLWLNS